MKAKKSAAIALCALALFTIPANEADAKTPGATHCYGGVCHRILTIQETAARIGLPTRMYTSHYDSCERDPFNPCGLTSSGAEFRPDLPDNAASSVYPDGTIILVYNAASRTAAVVRVNSLGPFKGNRLLDVSRATAERLGFAGAGVAQLFVTVLKAPTHKETRYQGWRKYAPVPGFIGRMRTLDEAIARSTGQIGGSLPPLRPILAMAPGQAKQRPLLPELPMTSSVGRFAVGVVSSFTPKVPAVQAEPAKTAAKTAAGDTRAVGTPAMVKAGQAQKVAETEIASAASKDPEVSVFVAPLPKLAKPKVIAGLAAATPPAKGPKRVREERKVGGAPNALKGRITPAMQRSLESRQHRMGLATGSQRDAQKCRAKARDPAACDGN